MLYLGRLSDIGGSSIYDFVTLIVEIRKFSSSQIYVFLTKYAPPLREQDNLISFPFFAFKARVFPNHQVVF